MQSSALLVIAGDPLASLVLLVNLFSSRFTPSFSFANMVYDSTSDNVTQELDF